MFARDVRTNEFIKANLVGNVEIIIESKESQNIVIYSTEDHKIGVFDFKSN